MDRVLTLIHLPLEPGWEYYSLLDRAVADIEHDLVSILTDSTETSELKASFDQPVAMPSSGFLHSVLFLIILNCSFLPNIKSHTLYAAMLGCYFSLYHWQTKCQLLN